MCLKLWENFWRTRKHEHVFPSHLEWIHPEARFMKKRVIFLVVFVLLIAGAGFGYLHRIQNRSRAKEIVLYGNVDIRQIQLAFHGTGRIQKLAVQEGDYVKSGDLVAEIDPVRYEASVARAAAEVARQKQILARLLAGSRPEEIREAKAQVNAAEAKWKDAKLVYERNKTLFQQKTVSQQKLDDAERAFDSARAWRTRVSRTRVSRTRS